MTTPEQAIGEARVVALLSTPGLYVVVMRRGVSVVEVDHGARCYQCKPAAPFERDGELARERWLPEALQLVIGPFGRAT